MKIASTIRKPIGVPSPAPSLIIADESGEQAVVLSREVIAGNPDLGIKWGAFEHQMAMAVAGIAGSQAGAPIKIAALYLKNQKLFNQATKKPGDGARIGGVLCSMSSAIASAFGMSNTSNFLKLGSSIFTAVADTKDEFVSYSDDDFLNKQPEFIEHLNQIAERVDVEQSE